MKKIEVTTINETPRPTRKPTKKQLMKIERIAQEQWEDDLELEIFQFKGYESLQLAFNASIDIMNVAYMLDKSDLKQAFHNAFEIYSRPLSFTKSVQRQGIHSISNAKWANQKWYNLTQRDLFLALKPHIQDLLRKQGVNYDN